MARSPALAQSASGRAGAAHPAGCARYSVGQTWVRERRVFRSSAPVSWLPSLHTTQFSSAAVVAGAVPAAVLGQASQQG